MKLIWFFWGVCWGWALGRASEFFGSSVPVVISLTKEPDSLEKQPCIQEPMVEYRTGCAPDQQIPAATIEIDPKPGPSFTLDCAGPSCNTNQLLV